MSINMTILLTLIVRSPLRWPGLCTSDGPQVRKLSALGPAEGVTFSPDL